MGNLLEVNDLTIKFRTAKATSTAVRNVSFSLEAGETLCIVGESGSGKSITSLSLMGLLPENGEVSNGSIRLNGEELVGKTEEELRKIRGNEISMIFQEPMTALNPVFTVGYQIQEPLRIHKRMSKQEATVKSVELLKQVGIPNPKEKIHQYPHELSGGMRQRVMIAMALACEPSLLIADEPTTALDVTIQAQILDIMDDLKEEFGMGVVFVTHDMGVVAEIADRVMVMYAGDVIEVNDVQTLFEDPKHPYTKGLLGAVPNVDDETQEMKVIPGSMPSMEDDIPGCRFHPRCPMAMDICKEKKPALIDVGKENAAVRCWLQEVDTNADTTIAASGGFENVLSD
ncbi:ATP-binding cassette domain-containing protein [Ornithinibacillus sp. L9]|uniref:ATP-binding cassette domain-containing protein n=1 Tax=Ornithinibacillus caprae TaxID=2678566 RepID=A0A6N8FD60_9BACI|nr:ABC transporter ATP-binding protein [Ornithinibacillus caprae]MUK87612.1 ATP-binding cassette domain-containing protein [Ornithinibacillus caprae]